MSQVYSGTEYNRKLRSDEPKTLIKLTNGAGIHRGCDYNLPASGEPKRIDDHIRWNSRECESGGIYFVAGEEYVVEWLNYSPDIGRIERAFLVQIPEEDDVKVIEFDKKVKASSIVICKELDFEAVVRTSQNIRREKEQRKEAEMRKEAEERRKEAEERRKESEERERAKKEFQDRENAKNKAAFGLIMERLAEQQAKIRPEIHDEEFKNRLEFVKKSLNVYPEAFSVACVNVRFVNEAYEALQEYGSLDNIPLSDRRVASFFSSHGDLVFKDVQRKAERIKFWWIYDCVMLRLRSFIRNNVGKTVVTSIPCFSADVCNGITKYRDDLILVGPFSSVELDCVLTENWPVLFKSMSTNPERFFS